MENAQAYKEVIEKIMENKIKLFGYFAVRVAKAVHGIELDDNGKVVSIFGNPQEIIHQLLVRFEDKAGEASTLSVRALIVPLKNKYPGLVLPEEFNYSLNTFVKG